MRHKLCDPPVDQINKSNKISHQHEDSKQEPESSGESSSLNDLSGRGEEPLLTERYGTRRRSVLLAERLKDATVCCHGGYLQKLFIVSWKLETRLAAARAGVICISRWGGGGLERNTCVGLLQVR